MCYATGPFWPSCKIVRAIVARFYFIGTVFTRLRCGKSLLLAVNKLKAPPPLGVQGVRGKSPASALWAHDALLAGFCAKENTTFR